MPRWELRISRSPVEQIRGARRRTVGTYEVYRDGQRAPEPYLSGTTAEARGPGSNSTSAKSKRCIAPGTYPLRTTDGPTYVTDGYRNDLVIAAQMPGLELMGTGARSDILIHPGKNSFLSAVGCINPCTVLPDAAENIDYPGSRRRVIALIEDLRGYLGQEFPTENGRTIPHAFVTIS